MWAFVGRRILIAVPVLFGASIALFLLLYVLPGDPAAFVLGDSATPIQLATLRHTLRLDQPVPLQYLYWLGSLLRGDLGDLLVNGYPVARLIAQRLPVALQLTAGSLVIGCTLGGAAGMIAGIRPDSRLARLIDFFNATAIAVPVFWLGLLLQILVAVKLGWLPAGGTSPSRPTRSAASARWCCPASPWGSAPPQCWRAFSPTASQRAYTAISSLPPAQRACRRGAFC